MNTMQWRPRSAAAILAILALAAASPLGAAGATRPATVGDLAAQVAQAAGLALPAGAAPQAAIEALAKMGIRLGADPGAAVTERTLVEVGRAVGAPVTSSRPGRTVSASLSQAFVRSIQGPLQQASASAQGGTAMIHVSCQGRESRQGRKGTPASNANPNATADPCEEPIP